MACSLNLWALIWKPRVCWVKEMLLVSAYTQESYYVLSMSAHVLCRSNQSS